MAANSRPISRQRLEGAGVVPLVLEQPGVLDRHRDVRGELAQDGFVGLRELADRVAEKIQRADHAALAAQRHDELGVRAGHGFDVARIGVDVVDEDRLPFGDRGADQALPHLHPQRARDVVGIADRVRDRQLLAPRIEQVHGERLELRQAGDELRDLVQQLVQVEDRRDLAAKRKQRRQRLDGGHARVGLASDRSSGHRVIGMIGDGGISSSDARSESIESDDQCRCGDSII